MTIDRTDYVEKAQPAPELYEVCYACRRGEHDRCTGMRYTGMWPGPGGFRRPAYAPCRCPEHKV